MNGTVAATGGSFAGTVRRGLAAGAREDLNATAVQRSVNERLDGRQD